MVVSLIDDGSVEDGGEEVVAGPLHVVVGDLALVKVLGLRQDGSLGVHPHHHAVGTLLLQLPANP